MTGLNFVLPIGGFPVRLIPLMKSARIWKC